MVPRVTSVCRPGQWAFPLRAVFGLPCNSSFSVHFLHVSRTSLLRPRLTVSRGPLLDSGSYWILPLPRRECRGPQRAPGPSSRLQDTGGFTKAWCPAAPTAGLYKERSDFHRPWRFRCLQPESAGRLLRAGSGVLHSAPPNLVVICHWEPGLKCPTPRTWYRWAHAAGGPEAGRCHGVSCSSGLLQQAQPRGCLVWGQVLGLQAPCGQAGRCGHPPAGVGSMGLGLAGAALCSSWLSTWQHPGASGFVTARGSSFMAAWL